MIYIQVPPGLENPICLGDFILACKKIAGIGKSKRTVGRKQNHNPD